MYILCIRQGGGAHTSQFQHEHDLDHYHPKHFCVRCGSFLYMSAVTSIAGALKLLIIHPPTYKKHVYQIPQHKKLRALKLSWRARMFLTFEEPEYK